MQETMRTSVGFLLLWCLSLVRCAAGPNIAFFYGPNPPWEELQAFDIVVVEPGHGITPKTGSLPRTEVFAYVSAGEVEYDRPYAKDLPSGAARGSNDVWRSHVIDQTHTDWPRFFLEHIVAPLWHAGYRGFFLDNLDSFHLIAETDEERARQAQGLAAVIRALRAQFPEAKLIFNRGFEILPHVHTDAYAVAAESLLRGWDQKSRQYKAVAEADRAWLLQNLERVRGEYKLPVVAIEYAPPGQRALARETARKIAQLGFIPWVTNSEVDQLGVGNIEVTPRKVLMLYDGGAPDSSLYASRKEQATKALGELGYAVEYADVSRPLPAYPLVGRYAGVVSWLASDQAVHKPGVREWLARQREHGVRMAVLGKFPFPLTDSLASAFGLSVGLPRPSQALSVDIRDPLISREAEPPLDRSLFTPLRANRPDAMLLRLKSETGDTMDAAALMPWGGYVLAPYESMPLSAGGGDRWLIEPVEFMRRALALTPATARRVDGEERRAAGAAGPSAVSVRGAVSPRAQANAIE